MDTKEIKEAVNRRRMWTNGQGWKGICETYPDQYAKYGDDGVSDAVNVDNGTLASAYLEEDKIKRLAEELRALPMSEEFVRSRGTPRRDDSTCVLVALNEPSDSPFVQVFWIHKDEFTQEPAHAEVFIRKKQAVFIDVATVGQFEDLISGLGIKLNESSSSR